MYIYDKIRKNLLNNEEKKTKDLINLEKIYKTKRSNEIVHDEINSQISKSSYIKFYIILQFIVIN